MAPNSEWCDLGPIEQFTKRPLTATKIGTTRIVVTHRNGEFGALSGVCNHAGGPLAEGRLDGEYLVCPWHNWKYHWRTGLGEPGFEGDAVPQYDVRAVDGRLHVSTPPVTKRTHLPHPPHAVARKVERAPGPVRVLGISATNMDINNPRYSTSDALLAESMAQAASLGAETKTIHLTALRFRPCEGYYSKSAHACTWPCSITQMDPEDQMDRVYEAQFPYVAHSRGWTAEDMERNVEVVKHSKELREGARSLAARAIDHAQLLLDHEKAPHSTERGGRKAHKLVLEELGTDEVAGEMVV